jgi:hypothetical protein
MKNKSKKEKTKKVYGTPCAFAFGFPTTTPQPTMSPSEIEALEKAWNVEKSDKPTGQFVFDEFVFQRLIRTAKKKTQPFTAIAQPEPDTSRLIEKSEAAKLLDVFEIYLRNKFDNEMTE